MLILLAWIAIWLATLVVRGAGLSAVVSLAIGIGGAGIAGLALTLSSGTQFAWLHFIELAALVVFAVALAGVARWRVRTRQVAQA